MKDDVKVSIIMLTYNRQDMLSRSIESILRQTYKNFEFIIIDNGSSDSSGHICDLYAQKDKRIIVKHIKKNTIGFGRNQGLDIAKGKYITFIDDDDEAENDMIEFLVDLIKRENADISICGSFKGENGIKKKNFIFHEKIVLDTLQGVIEYLKREKFNAAMPTKMLKKELTDKIRFCEKGKYDDIMVAYRYFCNSRKTVICGEPKYCFWRHDNNNSKIAVSDNMLSPEQLEEYFYAFDIRTKYIGNHCPELIEFAKYSEWSYMISMCDKIVRNKLYRCSKQLKYIKKEIKEHLDEFYYGKYIKDFEKDYVDKYIINEEEIL